MELALDALRQPGYLRFRLTGCYPFPVVLVPEVWRMGDMPSRVKEYAWCGMEVNSVRWLCMR